MIVSVAVLVGALLAVLLGQSSPLRRVHRSDLTFTISIDSGSVAAADAVVRSQPRHVHVFKSAPQLIWSFLCENLFGGEAPIPRFVGTTGATAQYSVRLSPAEIDAGVNDLQTNQCALSYDVVSIQSDYRWAARPLVVQQSIVAAANEVSLFSRRVPKHSHAGGGR